MDFFDRKQEFLITIQSDVLEIIDPSQQEYTPVKSVDICDFGYESVLITNF